MAAMVQLRTSWEIKYQDDKWMSLPSTLVETFEGNAYLKIRPSHPSIVKLVSRSKVKNPSLSSSVHLQKMLQDRNTAAMTFLMPRVKLLSQKRTCLKRVRKWKTSSLPPRRENVQMLVISLLRFKSMSSLYKFF